MSERIYILIATLPLITVMFILGLISPKISRKEILFGVKVPLEKIEDLGVIMILRSYYKKYLIICGCYVVSFIVVLIFTKNNVIMNIGVFILLCLIFLLYFKSHNEIKKLKNKNGWKERKKEVVIIDTDFRKSKERRMLPPIAWFLVPIIIIIINIVIGFSVFESIPLFIPSFWNIRGEIQGALLKTYKIIFIIPILQIFTTIFMIVIYKIVGWSKQQLSIENPEISREKNRLFRYRWGVFIIITNVLSVLLNTMLNLQLLQVIRLNYKILILLNPIFTMFLLLGILFMFLWTGQGGSRINLKVKNERKDKFVDRDEDKYWKIGLIYFNPNDAALFVEKRFGFGWGLNYGKISAYIFILAVVALFFIMNYVIEILSMP